MIQERSGDDLNHDNGNVRQDKRDKGEWTSAIIYLDSRIQRMKELECFTDNGKDRKKGENKEEDWIFDLVV